MTAHRCRIPGCPNPAKTRDLCQTHYGRWWRGTRMERQEPVEAVCPWCGVEFLRHKLTQRYCCHAHQVMFRNRRKRNRPAVKAEPSRVQRQEEARQHKADERAGQMAAVLGLDLSPWRYDAAGHEGAVVRAGRWAR